MPLRRGAVVKKRPPFFNAGALITRKIMRSRDAQCNTGNDLKKTKMVMYSITLKLNSTFGTIGKATADKITTKVVGKLKLSL